MSYKVSAPSTMIPQPIWPPCSAVTQIIKNICLAFLSTFFLVTVEDAKKPVNSFSRSENWLHKPDDSELVLQQAADSSLFSSAKAGGENYTGGRGKTEG